MSATTSVPEQMEYPDSDGKPMSDNTIQARWIVLFYTNLMAMFGGRDDVFIAADLLWYPVEGNNKLRQAPDVMVVFGRPKGDRGSYKQWEESCVPITVAFEILSPGNDQEEMARKFVFYEEHGVEEYYIYDPDTNLLTIYKRGPLSAALVRERKADGYVSPRLGIRFDLSSPEMAVYRPNGQRFLTLQESEEQRNQSDARAAEAAQVAETALRRAAEAAQAAERAENRAARLTRLGELNRLARRGHATPEEIAEIERLEAEDLTSGK
jgi:Uma2 family endonuclease